MNATKYITSIVLILQSCLSLVNSKYLYDPSSNEIHMKSKKAEIMSYSVEYSNSEKIIEIKLDTLTNFISLSNLVDENLSNTYDFSFNVNIRGWMFHYKISSDTIKLNKRTNGLPYEVTATIPAYK